MKLLPAYSDKFLFIFLTLILCEYILGIVAGKLSDEKEPDDINKSVNKDS